MSIAKLTPREREVPREVANGRLNKQIAFDRQHQRGDGQVAPRRRD